MRSIDGANIEPPPTLGESAIDAHCILGVGKAEKRVVFLLDVARALGGSADGAIGVAYTSVDGGGSLTGIGLLVRGGYNIQLTPALSFWPTLGLGYTHLSSESNNVSASGYVIPLQVVAPVLS